MDQDILVAMIEALILLPALGYVVWGRPYRRRMILSYFTPRSIADYFDQFWAGSPEYAAISDRYRTAVRAAEKGKGEEAEKHREEKIAAEKELTRALLELYDKRFGWISYFVPIVVLAVILLVEARMVAAFVDHLLAKNAFVGTGRTVPPEFFSGVAQLPDKIAVASLAGAYLWVGIDLFRRASSLTLLPSDFWYYSLRLMIAPILGFAVGTVAGNADTAVLVAFTIALLPIADIITWARSISAKAVNVTNAPEDAADKLLNLPGVDSNVAARLEDQGISTILQLCEADPVQLSMRTGLDFAFVVRLVDEALAWCYFGTRLRSLHAFGWSGASDILVAARAVPSASAVGTEEAADRYSAAKAALRAATAKVAKLKPGDPEHQDALKSKEKAERKYADAQETLKVAASAALDHDLIEAIAGVSDLKLVASGIRNSVCRIDADSYAQFIRHLRYEIQAQPAAVEQPGGITGWLTKLFSGRVAG